MQTKPACRTGRDRRLKTKVSMLIIFFLGLWSVVFSLWSPPAFAGDDWLEGASGYARGLEQSKASGRPMISFFYTDWCPYCQKFQKNVLAKPEVQKALSSFVKVRINPEKGSRENELAEQYGVQGYPAVFFENPTPHAKPEEVGAAIRNTQTFISALKRFAVKH